MQLSRSQVISLYKRHMAVHKAAFYGRAGMDIVMGRREGIYFWDEGGRRYVNCHCNGGVFNLGHRNPAVLQALQQGLAEYDIGNHHLISAPRAALAKQLIASLLMPKAAQQLSRVIFGVSGGEAADLAIKLARGRTGRQVVVSLEGGYHGHTGLALAAGDPRYRDPFAIHLPGYRQVPFGNLALLEKALPDAAALILETVPATLGMPVFPPEDMRRIRTLCDQYKVPLILDEIQTGLGRTGKIWGFQHYGIVPDIVITGKGFSGGLYPVSATCYREEFESVFKKDPFIHVSTFGGAEAGCFAAMKVLEIVSDPEFLKNVEERGRWFGQEWEKLRETHSEIREVRRLGMFMGIVFDSPETCLVLVRALFDRGIFAVYANNDRRVLQFLPPLIVTEEQSREIMDTVADALFALRKFKYRAIKKILEIML